MTDQADDAVELEEELIDDEEELTPDDEPEVDVEDDGTDEEESSEVELEDIEIDGEVYSLPKAVRDKVMMQADYTRKTQDLAEERRTLGESNKQKEGMLNAREQQLDSYADLRAIQNQINDYHNLDWVVLQQQDPAAFQQHQAVYRQLETALKSKETEIQQQAQELQKQQQEFTVKRIEETQRQLAEIEGWSPENAKKQAETIGFSQDLMAALAAGQLPDTVPVLKALHKASLYDQMMEKAKQAKKKVVNVKPNKKVAGKQQGKKNIYDKNLTPEQRINLFRKK